MKSIEIKGQLRKEIGKKATAALRKEDNVPCVIYGGKENVNFFAATPSFKKLVYTPHVYIVKLDIEGKNYTAIMKEIQFHPVTDKILHIDFTELSEDKSVVINIPVHITGSAIGVKKGGKLNLVKRYLRVKGVLAKLPDVLDVNVEDIEVGQSVKVGDLKYKNITILNGSREPVVSVLSSRVTAKTEGEGAEGEVAAGTAAPVAGAPIAGAPVAAAPPAKK